jgi:glycosyltransferase involved in cell wall biosynthesis
MRRIVRKYKPQVIQVYSAEAAWIAGVACNKLRPSMRPRIVGVLTGYPVLGSQRVGWKHCHVFTAISKHLRNVLDAPGSPLSSKPWVIPYGVNTQHCYPGYAPTATWLEQWKRETAAIREAQMTICVPGGISPLHGLEDIVPILTGLKRTGIDAHVFIAGDTRHANSEYLAALKQKFADAQLSEHITWLGARADLRDVLCACDVTLSLTLQPESFGKTTLEALSLGRPVAGYEHGGVGEQLEQFLPAGMVPTGDTTAMAELLEKWYTDRPTPLTPVPAPYRRSDMIQAHIELYQAVSHK